MILISKKKKNKIQKLYYSTDPRLFQQFDWRKNISRHDRLKKKKMKGKQKAFNETRKTKQIQNVTMYSVTFTRFTHAISYNYSILWLIVLSFFCFCEFVNVKLQFAYDKRKSNSWRYQFWIKIINSADTLWWTFEKKMKTNICDPEKFRFRERRVLS